MIPNTSNVDFNLPDGKAGSRGSLIHWIADSFDSLIQLIR
jgi:hypothetical protein